MGDLPLSAEGRDAGRAEPGADLDGGDETTPISSIVDDPPRTPGRVNAGEAVTGTRGIPGGEAPPSGDPGQDSSLEDGR